MPEDNDMLCPWCLGELPGKPGQVAKCRHCGSDIHWGDGKPNKTIKDATAAKKKVVPVFEEFKTSKPELGRDEDTPKRATLERGTFEDLPWSDSKTPIRVEKEVPPAGFEHLLQHTGLTHICKQGGTESGTVVEDSMLGQMLQALSSLTDDEREMLTELLQKMG